MPKQIAPRLLSGDCRIAFGHSLPEAVKDGLRAIARREHRSMSWVLESAILDYFGLRRPKYKHPKPAPGRRSNVVRFAPHVPVSDGRARRGAR